MIKCSECCLTCSYSIMNGDNVLRCKHPLVNNSSGSVWLQLDIAKKQIFKSVNPFASCYNYNDELTTEPERELIIKNFLEGVCNFEHTKIW